jgi:hypothetical protein
MATSGDSFLYVRAPYGTVRTPNSSRTLEDAPHSIWTPRSFSERSSPLSYAAHSDGQYQDPNGHSNSQGSLTSVESASEGVVLPERELGPLDMDIIGIGEQFAG